MRITPRAKEATRARILDAARGLFATRGFDASSTRDVARAARIAAGTLFNYFPSKEALAMELVAQSLEGVESEFERARRPGAALDEELFAFAMCGLRRLEPQRAYLAEVLESALSPFAAPSDGAAETMRRAHLETIERLLAERDELGEPSFVSMHLYWTLYLGVLAFWSRDASPRCEDTLAVLDRSMKLFVASLERGASDGGGA